MTERWWRVDVMRILTAVGVVVVMLGALLLLGAGTLPQEGPAEPVAKRVLMDQSYELVAYSNAIARRLTSKQVGSMTYQETATLAGVELDAKGNWPDGFFQDSVRASVVSKLAEQEKVLAAANLKATLPVMVEVVSENPDGTLTVRAKE